VDAWAFGVLVAVAVVEIVLSLRWNKAYFSTGIPIFRQELSAQSPKPELPSSQRMEDRLSKSAFPPLQFRQLDSDDMGFREKAAGAWLRLSYTPVMHGLLRFDRSGARLEVIGFLNWFVLVFVLAGIMAAFSFQAPVFLVFLVGVLALIYMIQAKRFRQVATYALQEWNAVSREGAGA